MKSTFIGHLGYNNDHAKSRDISQNSNL